jgi:signal transduction histidine kinase
MTIMTVLIILMMLFLISQKDTDPIVKIDAIMVLIIAGGALIRIIKKKRSRAVEQLLDEINKLQRENENLKTKLDDKNTE